MIRKSFFYVTALLCLLVMTACESADCTLQNKVALYGAFYYEGESVMIDKDTLTITAIGTDSVLLNRGLKVHKFAVPMSYAGEVDTFVLHVFGQDVDLRDTLWVRKTNYPHFEAPDCPAFFFHDIKGYGTTNHFIDSIKLTFPIVDFSQYEHFKIYLRATL